MGYRVPRDDTEMAALEEVAPVSDASPAAVPFLESLSDSPSPASPKTPHPVLPRTKSSSQDSLNSSSSQVEFASSTNYAGLVTKSDEQINRSGENAHRRNSARFPRRLGGIPAWAQQRPLTADSTRPEIKKARRPQTAGSLPAPRRLSCSDTFSSSSKRAAKMRPATAMPPSMPRLTCFENGNQRNHVVIPARNLEELLVLATTKLRLKKDGVKLFLLKDGSQVEDISSLPRDTEVAVSCGEKFYPPGDPSALPSARTTKFQKNLKILGAGAHCLVSIRLNTNPRGDEFTVTAKSVGDFNEQVAMEQLLDTCTDRFAVGREIKKLYFESGKRVMSTRELRRGVLLYCSFGEPYYGGAAAVRKRSFSAAPALPEPKQKRARLGRRRSKRLGGSMSRSGSKSKSKSGASSASSLSTTSSDSAPPIMIPVRRGTAPAKPPAAAMVPVSKRAFALFHGTIRRKAVPVVVPPDGPHAMEKFLDDLTSKLDLGMDARRIFKEDGQAVKTLDQIERDEVIYVNCGGPFQPPAGASLPAPTSKTAEACAKKQSKALRIRLMAVRNGDARREGVSCTCTLPKASTHMDAAWSMEKFLDDVTNKLDLPKEATKLYTEDGRLVKDICKLENDTTVFVSCGEPFVGPPGSAKRSKKPITVPLPVPVSPAKGEANVRLQAYPNGNALADAVTVCGGMTGSAKLRKACTHKKDEEANGVCDQCFIVSLLEECTERMGLNYPAKRLYAHDGKLIKKRSQLSAPDMPVYVSCGEKFVNLKNPPKGVLAWAAMNR